MIRYRLLFLALALVAPAFMESTAVRAGDVSFNRDIRPILSDVCITCHGPGDAEREGGLRLDIRESAIAEADSGEKAIVPGDPAASELIARITSDDESLRMPPADSGKTLTAEQIDLLKQWIKEGAKYEGHWAFTAPQRPDVPEFAALIEQAAKAGVRNHKLLEQWKNNPLDRFALRRMLEAGLMPSPEADRETLIRRVTLDLTGLPPTIEQIDAFLTDPSPDAWEKLIDRLLASPHYGERMALPWLDSARFGDSNGFQTDDSRTMWAWRDWVINAYNRNLPFDQFTIEQLAGDLLPNATQDQIIATGFNRNHRLNGEGGRIVEEWFVETVIDRVETTGLTWLGLTLNCCRCHDHKYDPVSQREFYQLFAFFNSVDESGVLGRKAGGNTPPLMTIMKDEHKTEITRLEEAAKSAQEVVAAQKKRLPELVAVWADEARKELGDDVPAWQLLENAAATSKGGATLTQQDDGSWLASGKNPNNDAYTVTAPLTSKQFSGVLIDVFPDKSLPNQSLGRGSNGNFVLTGVSASISSSNLKQPIEVDFARSIADYNQPSWTADVIVGNASKKGAAAKNLKGWAVDGNSADKRLHRRLLLAAKSRVDVPADATLTVTLQHDSQFGDHNVGRFRVSTSTLAPGSLDFDGSGLPQEVRGALLVESEDRSKAHQKVLTDYFQKNIDNPIRKAEQQLAAAKKKVTDYRNSLPTTMIMKEVAPRDAFMLTRGEYDKLADKVERGVPEFLPPLPAGAPVNRLGLAQWIVDESNPLTARVQVNRIWERFFGTGLVKTSENFGSQAEYPSHPQLFDWLASEFMQPTVSPSVDGQPAAKWDMKAFQKLILMSATYRQRSAVTSDRLKLDPNNRLLSRGPRFRLTGELVRDRALAVSGLLVSDIGGPSVRPYMPAGVWGETSRYGDLRNYKHDKGAGLHRRSMYTIWKRSAAPPTMLLFDAPNREVCTVKRSRTNTPLQALSLLNEVTFVEAARKLAERMLREGGAADRDRVAFGFRLATARRPTDDEVAILVDGLKADRDRFKREPDAAKSLLGFGETAPASDLDAADLAAYALTANVLLNLDEFVMRE
ncbi:MAG: PSD1 and planctomycete cytochrome C domain-containing protein [Planctomycetota bacterium]|jgi:hypothetical protein